MNKLIKTKILIFNQISNDLMDLIKKKEYFHTPAEVGGYTGSRLSLRLKRE